MDSDRFDALTRTLIDPASRRALLGAALAGALAALAPATGARKKRKKAKFNSFGCVDVGKYCKNPGQCCSGRCEGHKCKAHDKGDCPEGDKDGCDGPVVSCTSNAGGANGSCNTTTGKAPYCAFDGTCFPCNKDADCSPFCGPDAACIFCTACPETGNTTCSGPSPNSCTFPE
jgi:hypothetical protein